MPYLSEAQEAFFNAHKKKLEREGVDVDEWNRASEGLKLPEHAASSETGKRKAPVPPAHRR